MKDNNFLLDSEIQKPAKSLYVLFTNILMLAAMVYATYLFLYYFEIQREITNPLLPSYTTPYIFGSLALKGVILMTGMLAAQTLVIFRKYKFAFYLLLIAFAVAVSGVFYLLFTTDTN